MKNVTMKNAVRLLLGLVLTGTVLSGCDNVTVDGDGLPGRDTNSSTGTTVETGTGTTVDTTTGTTVDTTTGTTVDTGTDTTVDTGTGTTVETGTGTTVERGTGTTVDSGTSSDSGVHIDTEDLKTTIDTETESTEIGWDDITAMTGCGCDDVAEVCGAGGACVPRCDGAGSCLTAVIDGTLVMDRTEGQHVYLRRDNEIDMLNNPLTPEQLWLVDMSNNQVTLVKNGADSLIVIGVLPDGATVMENTSVSDCTVEKVNTNGTEESIPLPDGFCSRYDSDMALDGVWLYSGGSEVLSPETIDLVAIRRLALDGSNQLEEVLSGQSFLDIVAQNGEVDYWENVTHHSRIGVNDVNKGTVVFSHYGKLCIWKIGTSVNSAQCAVYPEFQLLIGATEDTMMYFDSSFGGTAYFKSMNLTGNELNVYLFQLGANDLSMRPSDWVTVDEWLIGPDTTGENVHRTSATAAREPHTLFPLSIVPGVTFDYGINNWNNMVTFTSSHMVWLQRISDSTGNIIRTLVVSRQLPPHMCDAELPCAEGESCGSDGFCVTP